MLKFVAAAVVATVATLVASSDVPLLHNARKTLGGYTAAQIQTCPTTDCSSGCTTVIEWPLNKCHDDRTFFGHGEIIRGFNDGKVRQCFRISAYASQGGSAGCKGKLVDSDVAVLGECRVDPHASGPNGETRFRKFVGTDKNVTMHADCDFGCRQCNVWFPIGALGQCLTVPQMKDVAIENGPAFSCGGSGWTELSEERFPSPTCSSFPNFITTQFTEMCYVRRAKGFQFVLI
jgi:hypothetical protein